MKIKGFSSSTRISLILLCTGFLGIFRLTAQNNHIWLPTFAQKDFSTAKGTISLFFPEEISKGESFSSVVKILPAGNSPQQIKQNTEFLSRCSLHFGGQHLHLSGNHIQIAVPEQLSISSLDINLTDQTGKNISRISLPIHEKPTFSFPENALDKFSAVIPEYVENGLPSVIVGPFDGDIRTSKIVIAGKEAEILAETERNIYYKTDNIEPGLNDIRIEEQGRFFESQVRIIGMELSASRTNLRTGEQTTIQVNLTGLENIGDPLPLYVENLTPMILNLEGGNRQSIMIAPEMVSEKGAWNRTMIGQSLKSGDFSIQAKIDQPPPMLILPTYPIGETDIKTPLIFEWQSINLSQPCDFDLLIYRHKKEDGSPEIWRRFKRIKTYTYSFDEKTSDIDQQNFFSWQVIGNTHKGLLYSPVMNYWFGPVEPAVNPDPPGDPCKDPDFVEKEKSDCQWIIDMEFREPLGDAKNDFNDFRTEWKEHFRDLSRTMTNFEMQISMAKYWIGEGDKIDAEAQKVQKLANILKGGVGKGITAYKEGGEEALKEVAVDFTQDRIKDMQQYAVSRVSETLGALYDLEDLAIRQIGLGIAKGITGVYPDRMADQHRRQMEIAAADLSTWIALSRNRNIAFGEHPTLQEGITEMCGFLDQLDQIESDFGKAVAEAGFICIKCDLPADLREEMEKLRLEIETHIRVFGDTIDRIRQRLVEAMAISNNKKAYEDIARLGSFQANSEKQTNEIKHVLAESGQQFNEAIKTRKQ